MIRYRILKEQMEGEWAPFGVAYERGEQVVLFVPAWRAPKPLEVRSLEELTEKDYPSQDFSYQWQEIKTTTESVSHPIAFLKKPFSYDLAGEFIRIMKSASQALISLIFGDNWQLVPELELGTEIGNYPIRVRGATVRRSAKRSPSTQKRTMKLASGPLEGAEVEYTSANRLVITLNRSVHEVSRLKFVTETGEELKLKVIQPLDYRGRAIYDLSDVPEFSAFHIVLVEE